MKRPTPYRSMQQSLRPIRILIADAQVLRGLVMRSMASLILVGAGLGVALSFAPDAEARTKVQRIISNNQNSDSTYHDIEEVDPAKTIIMYNQRFASAVDEVADHLWAAELYNGGDGQYDQVHMRRHANGDNTNNDLIIYVIESDSFQVEFVKHTFAAGDYDDTVTLSGTIDFTDGKSFVYGYATEATSDLNDMNGYYCTYEMVYNADPTADQVRIRHEAEEGGGSTVSFEVWFFVVQLTDDSIVYHGESTLPNSDFLVTSNIGGSVDRTKSFLLWDMFHGIRKTQSRLDSELRGAITSDTEVGFNRRVNNFGDTVTVYWYVIEWGTLGFSEIGQVMLPINDTNEIQLSLGNTFDTTRAWTTSSQDSTGSGTYYHRVRRTSRLTNETGNLSTTLGFQRNEAGQQGVCDWGVTQLEPIVLFEPNGGEVWRVGTTENITWYAPTQTTAIEILLSLDGGSTYDSTMIVDGTPNDGQYEWTIPPNLGWIDNDLRVKVRDDNWDDYGRVDDTYSADASDANFEIKGQIVVVEPNGGNQPDDIYVVDQITSIQWTHNGHETDMGNVDIIYSTDSGATFPNPGNLIATVGVGSGDADAGEGAYGWTVPDQVSNQLRIRIEQQTDNTNVYDESNANFEIRPALTLTAPDGGETWRIGASRNITWQGFGSMPSGVDLLVSRNSGGTYDVITTGYTGGSPYSWTVAAPESSTNAAYIRVRSADYPTTVTDESDSGFTIQQSIEVTAPNLGTEVWRVATNQNITWAIQGSVPQVDIHYRTDGGSWTPIAGAQGIAGNSSPFSWAIPDAITGNAEIRIQKTDETYINDMNDAPFDIKASITVDQPTAAEVLRVSTQKTIQWTLTGTAAGTALIQLSKDGGTTYPTTLTTGTVNITTGTFNWTPTQANMGTNNRIKVALDADPDVLTGTAGQSGIFSVEADLTLLTPNTTGLSYEVGVDSMNITWDAVPNDLGGGDLVNLRYDTASGAGGYTGVIANSVSASAESYNWSVPNIPNILSNQFKVKVFQVGKDGIVQDTTGVGNDMTTFATVDLTAPNGGEEWNVNSGQSITWTCANCADVGNVSLDYATDGGTLYNNNIASGLAATDLSYAWTVPDSIGNQVRVRISSDDHPSAVVPSDFSAANFTIKGAFNLSAPNGGETWVVGSSENISWTTFGTVNRVTLKYDTASGGGGYPSTIVSNLLNIDAYSWAVADIIGTTNRVRIEDFTDATSADASNADFEVKGSVTLTAPNGGVDLIVGGSYVITWTKTGSIGNIRILYSTDGGSTYPNPANVIAEDVNPADGSYTWNNIPDSISSNVRIRLELQGAEAAVNDESDADNTIKGSLTITSPNTNVSWIVGASENITWTKTGTFPTVELHYSTDGGSTYPGGQLINGSVNSVTGTPYAWTIPDNISSQVRVRVRSVSNATVWDESDVNFSIKGSVSLTQPNSGTFIVGNSTNIVWSPNGSIGDVTLSYSTNGYADELETTAITTIASATLSYNWTIPDAVDSEVRVRVADTSDPTVNDVSTSNFEIRGSLTITAPNGGETWLVNDSENITWTKTGTIANVRLDYSTDGGSTYPNVITGSTSGANLSYAWTIPDAIDNDIRVRIQNLADANVQDASDSNFEIKGSLSLSSPNGAETWTVNQSRDITWTSTGTIANVALNYSTDSGGSFPFSISASTPNDGSFSWTVPDSISNAVRVRVANTADASVNDASNADFAIKGSLTLTAPNGSERWTVLSGQNVTWTRVGSIANVKLDYSTNSGSTYPNAIIASTDASTGTYNWTIPDTISSTVRVRVEDATDSAVFDTSNSDLAIVGNLVITAPNGGEEWVVGASQSVTWNRTGSIPNAELRYSTNSGSTFPNVIIGSTDASTGSYSWTIPDSLGNTVRVRITDTSDSQTTDDSNADFTIKASFNVTAPDGGEVWVVGESRNVTWTNGGSVSNVKIDYSTNGGISYDFPVVASTANTNSYSWTIPDNISATVKVRVSDVNEANAFDVSAANFKIRGDLTLTAPNGGQGWQISTAQNITWTKVGSIANVKLEYSTDDGLSYPPGNLINASVDATTGTPYSWTIPDNPGTQVRVQVSDVSDATVSDESDAAFSIKGNLTLTAPNGSETGASAWVVATTENITWNRLGNITNVELRYSDDNGATWPGGQVIVASTSAAAGSYSWTIPDSIGAQTLVRITDTADGTVTDDSDAPFEIMGAVVLTAPDGGEIWNVGDTENITWTNDGSFANVKLDYSNDGGATYSNAIVASTLNDNTFEWTVPDTIDNDIRVQVSDAANANVVDTSNSNFEIKGTLTLASPNGGETWFVDDSRNITWSSTGTIANVVLAYSTNGGSTYPNTIIASTPNDGTYSWTVPDAIGTALRVRVMHAGDASVVDTSDADFTIKGSLTLTRPNGGDTFVVLTSEAINWTRTGSIVNVDLHYSTNSGSTFPNLIVAATDASAGTYNWTVADAISTQARVRVMDSADNSVVDTSNSDFKIQGSVTVTAPNGAEDWDVSTIQTVGWTTTGTIANVKLDYSTDSGATFPNTIIASTPNDGTHSWTIPDNISTTARVRASDANDAAVYDDSDADFKIKASFTVTAPNGGETWIVSESRNVTWNTNGSVANVKLDYSTDGGLTYPNAIIASVANSGTYSWTIPDDISSTARVQVADVNDATARDRSDANFKITGDLTILVPNNSENWQIGTDQNITWNVVGSIANVKLEYSVDGGSTYPPGNLIVASTAAAAGTYSWTIPDNPSTTAKVQITDVTDSSVTDESDNDFSIKGNLVLTAPNGGEIWVVDGSQNITWTRLGNIVNVELRYSTDGGATFPIGNQIVASTSASALSYSWTIPDAIGDQLRVRITDTGDPTVTDTSAANFEIKGAIAVTQPNGAEVWTVGDSQNVTWTTSGSFPSVKLDYSTDGGSTFPNSIIASTPNDGSYTWTVPDAIGNQLRVRAQDTNDATVTDMSDGNFEVRGSVTVTSPNGGESWVVGNNQNITWALVGSIANLQLDYSTNGGSSYANSITASTDASLGSYSWTIPDAIGLAVRVRATDAADANVFDASDANFEIKGAVTITAPNGGELWAVGTSENITWTRSGSIANVELRYSQNGGTSYDTQIVATTDAATGSYSWTIPDIIGTQLKVRAIDASNATVFDSSDLNFKVVGDFTLTSPNGGESWDVGTGHTISWSLTGSVANARLDYSTNSGLTYPNVITASTPAGGLSYAWTIPDALSQNVRVRIADATDANVNDESDADFTIAAIMTLTAPDGGEVWTVGGSENITWGSVGSVVNVALDYSTDGGSTFPNSIVASTPSSGTYAWTIPDAISSTVRVRVSDAANANANDASNGNFKIRGDLALTAPNGGEGWVIGDSENVTWNTTGSISTVKLDYSTNSGVSYPNSIATGIAAGDETYAWTIPDVPSTTIRVQVTDESDPTVLDDSNADFSIQGAVQVTAPNGGETWTVGTSRNITWIRSGSWVNIRLEYSVNSGLSYPNVINASADASTQSYSWTIPDAIGTNVRVRAQDSANSSVTDESDADFSIVGALTVTLPNGGELWLVGESRSINWTVTGSIANVALAYSTDGGSSFPNSVIGSTPAAAGTYAWTVPDAIGSTLRVRVNDASNATVSDVSNNNFTIKGDLTLTAPNGGEAWVVGSNENITWSRVGSIATVSLEYSTNSGSTYPNLIVASTSGATGSYSWSIPDSIGSQLRVRVADTTDSSVNDTSDADFQIKGSLDLTSPNGAESLVVASSHNITWTRTGSFSNVELHYSTDSGATYPNTISASTNAATGSYSWTVPDNLTSSARVRIRNLSDTTVADASAANFKIIGQFTLTSPNGGEAWQVGTAQAITWNLTGSIANAQLNYSTNSGATFPNLITASTLASSLSYIWTIPDAISPLIRVRIADAGDATVNDVSDADFAIVADFDVTAPDGGEVWTVGDAESITWTTSGSVGAVDLFYSTDAGSTYPNQIVDNTPNTGTYGWTIPDNISTTARVRVVDSNNANSFDSSAANFKIRGDISVTAPNGSEIWRVAASNNITWTLNGTIANVRIDYSTDSGLSYPNLIVASTAGAAGSYAWTIPDAISDAVRVQISDVLDPTVLDESNNDFDIKGNVNVTAPNGGEVWTVDSIENITWTYQGSINNLTLAYSTNGGTSYPNTIVGSVNPAALTYGWTIPDAIGANLRVRATDTGDALVQDASDANFEIRGSLDLTAPIGGETWEVTDTENITWTTQGSITNVRLDYSTDSGATYPNTIVASTNAGLGTYSWIIPDNISSTVRVRVRDTLNVNVNDVSDADFKIAGKLALTAPNGGEVWTVGDAQAVTWNVVGSIANVALDYSTNGGVSYDTNITGSTAAGAGNYNWTIPDSISTTVRVRVSDATDSAVNDASDANFKIEGSLSLTAPNGGENWLITSSENITWSLTGSIANVRLDYSTNGGSTYPNQITASTPAAAGSYSWTIPDAATTTARVRVQNVADATVLDASNNNFRIGGGFTITAPNGGEGWTVASSRAITWNTLGTILNVDVHYSTNGGITFPNAITTSYANSGTYNWTIPDVISSTLRVRVQDSADPNSVDTSDSNFSIKGDVTITSPNGGEAWFVGENRNITWTRIGSVVNVQLAYSTDSGATFPNVIIASTDASAGTYSWLVPDAIGTTVRVRVRDASDATVTDQSNGDFTIRGSLTLNLPNGGEAWAVGSVQNITWTRTGSIPLVDLLYSTDAGLSFPNSIASGVNGADLSYGWTIPDAIGTQVRVKVRDANDGTVEDISDANFKITGSFTVTAPNGGERWTVASNQNITWTKTGSMVSARLEYSTNGGGSFPNTITASVNANLGSFLWTIPDNLTALGRVRISDVADPAVLDTSDGNFTIQGAFEVLDPDGGEKWGISSTQDINWNTTGSISTAELRYSTDGGATFPNVIANVAAANETYEWTIPDAATISARVRVSDLNDAAVFDDSDANFKILAGYFLTSPNGGEVWTVAENRNIVWSTGGSVANVKLDYSVDGGASYPNSISASTPNTGTFSWTVPDAIATTLRVRVADLFDNEAFDTSDANFKIRGALSVTAPNGGEAWIVNDTENITWTRTGTVQNVKLEYSTDSGTTYPIANTIAASVDASLGTFAWIIPDSISTLVRVKISDVTDATVVDESNANFIIRGGFTVTSPNGGENWTVGTARSVTWNTFGTIANVRLDYSTNSGSTFPNLITAAAANTGSYAWTIPDDISNTVRIKVSNSSDAGSLDISDADFKIMGGFTISAPNGGEVWDVNTSENITWTTAGSVSNVRITYSTDSGATFPNLVTASSPNSNSFNWTVSDAISTQVRVRVEDPSDADAFDISNANFKIRGSLELTAPNGAEKWGVGNTEDVTWTAQGSIANVKLDLSTNSGATFPTLIVGSTPNDGTYEWTLPDAISTQARVRVTDVTDSSVTDSSNADFSIQGTLRMTSPNGGEQWQVGSLQTLTWNRFGSIANVRLEYSTNSGGVYNSIVASTANSGTYGWTIPDAITTQARVRITDINDITVTDASDADFKIQAGFTLTSPNGGEAWGVGSSQNITWSTNGSVSFVDLSYSTDGGSTFPNVVASSQANTGTYGWIVPDDVSGSVRVRVASASDPTANDDSNANFRIRATLTVLSPNGGEDWTVGDVENIVWNSVGTVPSIKLEYSNDGFTVNKFLITAGTADVGTYNWTVPDYINGNVRVRVSDANDVNAFDDSNGNFTIRGGFNVTAPNGGEQWIVGTTETITWTQTGSVTNARIEYSTDGGGTFPNLIIGLTANDGSYDWVIPDNISAIASIRISDPNDALAFDISDAVFKIRGDFTLTAPNGGQVFVVDDATNITWTHVGTIPNARLDYSTDSGATFPSAIVASTANDGSYAWTVPDAISTQVRVRVRSTTDADATDMSDGDFKIRGDLVLTAPDGGESWAIANPYNITWNTTGTIPNVNLHYSMDSGATYPNLIASGTPNSNSYSWTIPDTPTPSGRVRVQDPNDTSVVFDESDADFNIIGSFNLTAPNGGEIIRVDDVFSIDWSWGGTIPNVTLRYSTDSGATYPNVIAASTANGAGASGTHSYNWTVPDDISETVRVQVADANDASVNDVSDADFAIKGRLTLTAPNGGERWVTNENRTISWTTNGTIPNVDLHYSTNSGATYPNVIASGIANTGNYSWNVADEDGLVATSRIRVQNPLDAANVNDASDADFSIDYYYITWELRDLLTNQLLALLSVSSTDGWAASDLASPLTQGHPFGSYTATWSRAEYGDSLVNFVSDKDQTIQVFMETQVVHIWEVVTEISYTASTDSAEISSTLRRDGSIVPGVVDNTIEIYDGTTLVQSFNTNGPPDVNGFYGYSWAAPTGLVSGKAYNVISKGTIGSGGVFTTPSTFSITAASQLQAVQDTVNNVLDVPISQVQQDLQDTLDAQTVTIQNTLDAGIDGIEDATDDLVVKTDQQIALLSQEVVRVKEAGDELQKRGIELKASNMQFSGTLLLPSTVLVGDTNVVLAYRGPTPGLQPMITVTTVDNSGSTEIIVDGEPMVSSSEYPDVYEYVIDVISTPPFTAGKFVDVVVQATVFDDPLLEGGPVDNLEAGSFVVESTTLSTLEGLVAGQAGVKSLVNDSLSALRALQASFGTGNNSNIQALLQNLTKKVDRLPAEVAKAVEGSGRQREMRDTLNEVAQQLRALAGDNMGVDLTQIVGSALEESSTLKEIRGKANRVQGTTEVMQKIMEQKFGGVDAPVVHVIYE